MNFSTVIIPQLAIFKTFKLIPIRKEQNLQKPCNNVIMPRSPRDSGKNAVLVPPKLSSELELRSMFLGQFWRHKDSIFSSHSESLIM